MHIPLPVAIQPYDIDTPRMRQVLHDRLFCGTFQKGGAFRAHYDFLTTRKFTYRQRGEKAKPRIHCKEYFPQTFADSNIDDVFIVGDNLTVSGDLNVSGEVYLQSGLTSGDQAFFASGKQATPGIAFIDDANTKATSDFDFDFEFLTIMLEICQLKWRGLMVEALGWLKNKPQSS